MSGRADLAVPFSLRYDELAARYGVNRSRFFIFSDGTVLQTLVLNTRRSLFRSVKLRKAVSFAVNRRALRDAYSRVFGLPTDQFLSPAIAGFRDVRVYPLRGDLRQAQRLVGARPRVRTAVLYTVRDPRRRGAGGADPEAAAPDWYRRSHPEVPGSDLRRQGSTRRASRSTWP